LPSLGIQRQNISRYKFLHGSWLLKSDKNSVRVWCISIYMQLKVNKTTVISFGRKISSLVYYYKLCESSVICSDCIKSLGVFTDTKLHFYYHVDNIFSQIIGLLALIRTETFSFSPLHSVLVLYFTLVRSKVYYTSVAWNSFTFNVFNLEGVKRTFVSCSRRRRFFQSRRLQL